MTVNKYTFLVITYLLIGCTTGKISRIKKEWLQLEFAQKNGCTVEDIYLLHKVDNKKYFKLLYKLNDVESGYYNGYLINGKIVLDGTSYSSRKSMGGSYHETYSQFKEGQKHGVSYTLDRGKILALNEYDEGKNNGLSLWCNGGNNISSIGNYEKGFLIGKYFEYYQSGSIKSIFNLDQGVYKGDYIKYHANGLVKEKGNYSGSFISYKNDSIDLYKLPFFNEKSEYVDIKQNYSKEFQKGFFQSFNQRLNDNAFFLLKEGNNNFYDTTGVLINTVFYNDIGDIITK